MNIAPRTRKASRNWRALPLLAAICLLPLPLPAAETPPATLERLFFTPAQRADLQAARARPLPSASPTDSAEPAPAVVKFDGVLIRSDGKTTRWVDGKAQIGTAGISNMKPGQIRANGKLYEPYQVQRPQPASNEKDATP
ncbi:MAG TPA: hypothetical protein PLE48_03640 [Thiobacillus sp.]|nr:hypothetical protein [Thiobacillus sp.]HQT69500.1 hypothetical protein [Thiobacillus sp.]